MRDRIIIRERVSIDEELEKQKQASQEFARKCHLIMELEGVDWKEAAAYVNGKTKTLKPMDHDKHMDNIRQLFKQSLNS